MCVTVCAHRQVIRWLWMTMALTSILMAKNLSPVSSSLFHLSSTKQGWYAYQLHRVIESTQQGESLMPSSQSAVLLLTLFCCEHKRRSGLRASALVTPQLECSSPQVFTQLSPVPPPTPARPQHFQTPEVLRMC